MKVNECIGKIEQGCEIFGLTAGQFSFVDIIEHCASEIGRSRCIISTWSASILHIDRILEMKRVGLIDGVGMIIDRSFKTCKPDVCAHLVNNLGIENVKTASIHAKFAMLWNENRRIVIFTSANLNKNPRNENFEIVESMEMFTYLKKMCDNVFADNLETEGFSTKNEIGKVAKHMKVGELWQNQISLNTARLNLNA